MKRLLRHSRPALLIVLLALGGLAVTAGSIPAAHAATHPSINATGGDQVLSVGGTGFTPNGSVKVQVRLYNTTTKTWHLEATSFVKAQGAHYVCHTSPLGRVCYLNLGGEISAGFVSQPGTVHVVAYDVSSATWSNKATAYVYPIP
jgi:hypothetical protein